MKLPGESGKQAAGGGRLATNGGAQAEGDSTSRRSPVLWRRITAKRIVLGIAALIVAAQLVPFGRDHANPPVSGEPNWDSPQTRSLTARACFDCHSNETKWPWYTNVAPVSWLTQLDVIVGRRELNFSAWDRPQREARNAPRKVQEGDMPPPYYVPLHPTANLTPVERAALIQGLRTIVSTQGSR